jgi:hypothetical protein
VVQSKGFAIARQSSTLIAGRQDHLNRWQYGRLKNRHVGLNDYLDAFHRCNVGAAMRISEHFGLNRSQGALDFIDVELEGDTRAFVEPRAIRRIESEWAEGCVGLLQNFFKHVLKAVRNDDRDRGLNLLEGLREPNETHLGLSSDRPRGSGLGPGLIDRLWERLRQSEAAKTGLLKDLEDTALVIPEIDVDRISDMTTNIIRQPLIDYTQEMAEHYGIPTEQVGTGHTWNPDAGTWNSEEYGHLPVTPVGPLILVPKVIVRTRLDFNSGEYFRGYILEALQNRELSAGTNLVHTLKSGDKRVYKKDVRKKYFGKKPNIKPANEETTLEEPGLLAQYRKDKSKQGHRDPPLSYEDLENLTGAPAPDWDALLTEVVEVPTGSAGATGYHRAAERFLTAMFYPSLTAPRIESELHQGRKRVDIRYTNNGIAGFFAWAQSNYGPQPYVFVECKNYKGDLKNDALDQISGRFSKTRGTFGLLLCRSFKDKASFLQKCRDTASDDRGFVIVVDDGDLHDLVEARKEDDEHGTSAVFEYMTDRFAEIV